MQFAKIKAIIPRKVPLPSVRHGLIRDLKGPVYLIVICALWSFALLDAYHVIDGFLNDNRATQVTSVKITKDNLDFIEDTMVCIIYSSSILQHVWQYPEEIAENDIDFSDDAVYSLTLNNWTLTEQIYLSINFNSSTNESDRLNLTKQQFIHGLETYRLVRSLDMCEYDKALKPSPGACVEKRIKKYWTNEQFVKLNRTLFQMFSAASYNNDSFSAVSLHTFNSRQICHYIRASKIATNDPDVAREIWVKLGLRTNRTKHNIATVIAYYPFSKFPQLIPSNISSLDFKHTVTTRGLFRNKTELESTSPDCYGRAIAQYEATCEHYNYVQLLKEKCGCVPFWYSNLDDKGHENMEYCSGDAYNDTCMLDVAYALSNMTCTPCVTTQNNYVLGFSSVSSLGSSFRISFFIPDKFYSKFEDTTKNSLAQTVAQVGGDIGFYTGFSAWALWKFLMFFITSVRNRREHISTRHANENKGKDKFKQIFIRAATEQKALMKMAVGYLKEGDDGLKEKEVDGLKEKLLMTRLCHLEETTFMTLMLLNNQIQNVKETLQEERSRKLIRESQDGATIVDIDDTY